MFKLKGFYLNMNPTLKNRTSLIIRDIIDRYNLSNIKLGERLGCSAGVINSYRRRKTDPSGGFIEKICKEFGVNPSWLLTGKGDLYIKQGYKPVEASTVKAVESPAAEYAPHGGWEPRMKGEDWEMMGKAHTVLSSESIYRTALASNINAFFNALSTEAKLNEQSDKIKKLESDCDELKRRLADLEARLKTGGNPESDIDEPVDKAANG